MRTALESSLDSDLWMKINLSFLNTFAVDFMQSLAVDSDSCKITHGCPPLCLGFVLQAISDYAALAEIWTDIS